MSHRRKKPQTRRKSKASARGTIEVNRSGFGFVKTAEGDFFIPRSNINGAFDGDIVEIAKSSSHHGQYSRGAKDQGRRPEARVVRVIQRAHETLIGRYEVAEPFGVVIPDDPRIPHDIFTKISDWPGIENGSLVRVLITNYPTRRCAATGMVVEVLGDSDDSHLAVERVIARHNLETKFSDSAQEEASNAKLDISDALVSGYRDIRQRFVFTIDPADAKDFDDAISVEPAGDDVQKRFKGAKWILGVHIADVSHYVPWSSSIDIEARRRATSVYLADRVIPMLPKALSNELCSLKPDEDRRSMTVDLYVNDKADLVGYDIYLAVIRSKMRLTYDQALEMLESDSDNGNNSEILSRLKIASRLAQARLKRREEKGGLEFSTSEARVVLDDDGEAIGIDIRKKTQSTELIEEAMIFANEVVATHLQHLDWPCAYRVHEAPKRDSLEGIIPVIQEFSWYDEVLGKRIQTGDPHAIQEALERVDGRPECNLVTTLLLRAMTRALYSPQNDGHYGLGLSAYCHFTSPIRRYPDLIVHRMLRASLTKRPEKFDQEVSSLSWLCEHSSEMERIAETASRESQEAKMVEYMEQFIGSTFSAIISGVTSYGLYVQLDNTVEGFIPIRTLGSEYFVYEPAKYMLRGSDSGKLYRLGQHVAVVLKVADRQSSKLEFTLSKPPRHKRR